MPSFGTTAEQLVESSISSNEIFIFTKSTCPWCDRVKEFLAKQGLKFETLVIDQHGKLADVSNAFQRQFLNGLVLF